MTHAVTLVRRLLVLPVFVCLLLAGAIAMPDSAAAGDYISRFSSGNIRNYSVHSSSSRYFRHSGIGSGPHVPYGRPAYSPYASPYGYGVPLAPTRPNVHYHNNLNVNVEYFPQHNYYYPGW